LQPQKETNRFDEDMTNSVTIGVASLAGAVRNGWARYISEIKRVCVVDVAMSDRMYSVKASV